jgi:hypothetical protein
MIKKYSNFINEAYQDKYKASYKPVKLFMAGKPILFTEEKAEKKELAIKRILRGIYGSFSGNEILIRNGREVRAELLTKAQKNISILWEMIKIANEIDNGRSTFSTPDSMIDWIEANKLKLFEPGGKWFERIYKTLEGASDKGQSQEEIANTFFSKFATQILKTDISIDKPFSHKVDIAGIDGTFNYKGNTYTIQTKTLSSINKEGEFYKVYISGYFTEIKTNYLVLISDVNKKLGNWIFKGKDIKTQLDENGVNYYLIPDKNFVYKED